MSCDFMEEVLSMMENIYTLADDMDKKGFGKKLPFVDPSEGLRGAIHTDILLFTLRITDTERKISKECVDYLNTVLDFKLTQLTAEMSRKKALESGIPEVSILLPPFILLDKHLGGNGFSQAYLHALSIVAIGYLKNQESTSLTELMNYCRYANAGIYLADSILDKKIDLDPLKWITSDQMDIIKSAVELDGKIQQNNKNSDIAVLEKALKEITGESAEKGKADSKAFWAARYELIKDPGDGSDLDEEPLFASDEEEKTDRTGIEELNKLIGLAEIKEQVLTMTNVWRVRKSCEKLGLKRTPISMHMMFTGNPGTGKTTVARILGKIYHEAGILSKGHLVETSKADLVGEYVGHTAPKVKALFEKAKGGVLFIDEAYSLTSEGAGFGGEAIEMLLKLMEDEREDIVVVAAGYPALMEDFLKSNPGLRSRFSMVIHFPDYTGSELSEIFRLFCAENDIKPSHKLMESVRAHFTQMAAKKMHNFGNARDVRNFFEKMMMNQANRLVKEDKLESFIDLCRFKIEDIPQKRIFTFAPGV